MQLKSGLAHNENLNIKKVRLVNGISFLFGFSYAISAYILSFYFGKASGSESVNTFFFISYAVILVALLNLHKIIRKIGKSSFLSWSLFIKMAAALFLIFIPPSSLGITVLIGYIIFSTFSWVGLDIVLESYSEDRMSGRIRGVYLTIMNAGFLLGPFLSTQILTQFNFGGVFLVLFAIDLLIFAVVFAKLQGVNHDFKQNLTVGKMIKKLVKRKNVMRAYYISFILDFFFAGMIVYTPLYLRSLGLSLEEIGVIFTVMLLPFVIFQYPIGVLADKKMGEKEFLIIAIFLMGISTLLIYFIKTPSVAVWSVALFITRIGAALIEILRDSYFYKRIDGHDIDAINFFRTTRSVAYIAFTLLSGILIIFFPFKVFFLLLAAVVLSALYPAFKLVDNKCEEELNVCPPNK